MEGKSSIKTELTATKFIPLSEATKLTGYTPEYLNLLSRQGKLKAEKIGRNWYTKKIWLDDFLVKVADNKKLLKLEKKKVSDLSFKAIEQEILTESSVEYNKENFNKEENKKEVFKKVQKLELNIDEQEIVLTNNWRRIFKTFSLIVIILPLLFIGTYIFKDFIKNSSQKFNVLKIYSQNKNITSRIINENNPVGRVAGVSTQNKSQTKKIILASKNYKAVNVNVGGNILVLQNQENIPLKISNIRSESFVANKKNEVKLVISWRTNKLAISKLSYSKSGGQNPKVVAENSYGFIHSVILSGLAPRTSYIYQIKCQDHWANEISSSHFGIYTASSPVSVFDLISNAMGDVFGWAFKK